MKRVGKMLIFMIEPIVLFYLMECYEHNQFTEVRAEAQVFNILLFELIAWILFGLIGSARWALRMEAAAAIAFGLTNHYVMQFRSMPFVPWDLLSVKTAASVAGNYDFTPSARVVIVTILYLVNIIGLRFYDFSFKGKKRRVAALVPTTVIIMILIGFVGKLQDESFQTKHYLYPFLFTPAYMTKVNGMAVTFAMNLAYIQVELPQGYDVREAAALLAEYEQPDVTEPLNYPNVIVIMDEAFSDLAVLGDVNSNEDYMPFMHQIQQGEKNTVTGNLHVSVCGGNTANTEYEFLTGNTMAFLPVGSIPYQQYIREETPSLASHLSELGYVTYAMHPYQAGGWQRDTVYPLMGFDECFFINEFKNISYVRKYVSDYSDFENVIRVLEDKPEDKPAFIFNVTMQNHGGYTESFENFTEDITVPTANNKTLDRYLSLVRLTDEALQDLVEYLKGYDEPTILLFFGDHQPNNAVAKSFPDNDDTKRYEVPYLIWANFDIKEATNTDCSVNYLSSHLMEIAGVPTYDYQNFLMELEQYYPILSAARWELNGDGNDDMIMEYKRLQYYRMFDWKEN